MRYTFRWFGPKDPTSLSFIKQTGAKEIVTSLADVKYGEKLVNFKNSKKTKTNSRK